MGVGEVNYEDDDSYWENYETCPDGFCRHWSCNCECERKCKVCGERCPEHDDGDHGFEESEDL